MGRAGGGGGSRSGGSSSSSRSSGSHRSSSSRAGGGSRSYGGSSSSYSSHHHHYHGSGHYHGSTHHYYHGESSFATTLFAWAIVLLIVIATLKSMGVFDPILTNKSTIERTRVESGLSYETEVVIKDETYWIEDKDKVGRQLREFWDKTGVQPYIIMLEYDSSLKTDSDKEAYTESLYDEYIDREDALLFVYYGEKDLEGDVGLMCYTLGKQAASVFDGEAIDIWFNNIDYYWYGDGTMTDVYIKAYNRTAETIMSAPTNFWDFGKYAVIAFVIIVICLIGYKALKAKFKREKEKAQETEQILNATMNTISQGSAKESDDLLDKYK